ncbi:ester cyclase [Oceanobacter kriegii]|uniref:ester cyclase n=1 Tax=Oceanobacter kriegii TaxID=64972 RepID=UPI0004148944|nr:ester cyclase [Oceanobacter kriegii]
MFEDNKVLVEQFIQNAWGKGRFNLVRQMVSRDFLYHASQSMQSQGFDAFVDEIEYLQSAITDYDLTIEDLMSDGDRAISVMTLCGTFKKPIFGFQPHNKLVGITIAITWTLQRGRVRHMNLLVDIAHMQRQVAAA